ncbi:5'/3'-nucleotidase SurE [Streptomyces sp. WZ.A104]|uniref:5'/3'-nucleotidase SurE n=1 Tax=Streptomyces sp. WZ.A104 TaxID=2023771 RepID=UPI001C547715|nr:5'/3'-nucleotidase SurE [Streptomyces sp. WZ.A104]
MTNDDGVHSPGIRALAAAVAATGHEPDVVAPLTDRSGAGSAMDHGSGRVLSTETLTLPGLPGIPVRGIDGAPALAVLVARLAPPGARPWCVVSGINAGANVGRAVLHSGTVCAALTAATLGMSGLAVSVDSAAPEHLDTAARVAGLATEWIVAARKRTVLNVNVPDVPFEDLRGVRWGRLAAGGRARLSAHPGEAAGEVRLEADASAAVVDPRTDAGLLAAGYVTVTPLTGIEAVEDDTAASALDESLARAAGLR